MADDVGAFLEAIPDDRRRSDALLLAALMAEVTGAPPAMLGPVGGCGGEGATVHRERRRPPLAQAAGARAAVSLRLVPLNGEELLDATLSCQRA